MEKIFLLILMYFQIKKKIRGWKRRIRHIEQWANSCQFDHEAFVKEERDYCKIWIHPFYSLVKINPPIWYSRLILQKLIELHDTWKTGLDKLGETYYLKIWLYEQDLIRSQLVAAKGDFIKSYEKAFYPAVEKRKFPSEKFPLSELEENFSWELAYDDAYICEKSDELTTEEISHFRKRARKIEEKENDTLYIVKNGYVWIGTAND